MANNRELSQFASTVGYNGGNIGIGTDNPLQKLHLSDTTSANIYLQTHNSGTGSTAGVYFRTSNSSTADGFFKTAIVLEDDGTSFARGKLHILQENTADASNATLDDSVLTIDQSGNIGIGTDNPGSKLTVYKTGGNAKLQLQRANTANNTDDYGSILWRSMGGTAVGAINVARETAENDGYMFLQTASGGTMTERLRINSDGKVSISSDGTAAGLLTIKGNSDEVSTPSIRLLDGSDSREVSISNSAGDFIVSTHGTDDAIHGRIKIFESGVIDLDNGGSSGTLTNRLRIDSSGRLLVGSTSAREHLNDGSDSAQIYLEGTTQNTTTLAVIRNSNNDGPAHLVLGKSRGTNANSATVVQGGDTIGHINFEGADGNHLIRAAQISCVVDASPGTDDMPGRLSFSVTSDGSNNLVERMRINRKGFLKMGPRIKDSSHGVADLNSVRHEFTSDDNGWTMIVTHTSGAASEHEGILIDYNLNPNGTGNSFIQGNADDSTKFRFASNGGLYNYQSNDSNLCDEREKKNIVSLDAKWDKVKSWDLKKFHYNEDADSDDLRYGVIAQQVEEHCPEVVADWVKQKAESAVLDEDGNVVTPAVPEITRKGVKEQQMMWMAIKALQEAQTRIETLETQNADLLARVTALEGS